MHVASGYYIGQHRTRQFDFKGSQGPSVLISSNTEISFALSLIMFNQPLVTHF